MSFSILVPVYAPTEPKENDIAVMANRSDAKDQRNIRESSQPSRSSTATRSRANFSSISVYCNKTSSPADTPKPNFQFFICSHPSEANTSKYRKEVRSHVTKRQHQRKRILATDKRAQSYQPEAEVEESPSQRVHVATTPSDGSTLLELAGTRQHSGHNCLEKFESPLHSPLPSDHRSSVHIESANVDPRDWPAYVGRIMANYLSNIALNVSGVNGLKDRVPLRTRSFPLVPTDPACIYAVALMAISHYGQVQKLSSRTINSLQLKNMAIKEINNALADNFRGTTDQLIAAVAMIAACEALFGDRAVSHIHMQGFAHMVSLRRGPSALGLDNFLERILLWIGSNACYMAGSRLYFDHSILQPVVPRTTYQQSKPIHVTAETLSHNASVG